MLGLCTAPLIFWNHALLSKLKPAVPGAHITVQVIYTVWSEDGMKGALVYGMLVTNRVWAEDNEVRWGDSLRLRKETAFWWFEMIEIFMLYDTCVCNYTINDI